MLRYYIYISDTKLDMLFEQIDKSILKRISAEVKVDVKLASVTLRGADNPSPSRSAKLQVVERFIEQHSHVGTIQEPGREYFRGQLDMRWGWDIFGSGVWFQNSKPKSSPSQCVVLAGSGHHVLGESPVRRIANSSLPRIIATLHDAANIFAGSEIEEREKQELYREWVNTVEIMWDMPSLAFGDSPPQRVDFLAVPLVESHFRDTGTHVILATPLYVALAR